MVFVNKKKGLTFPRQLTAEVFSFPRELTATGLFPRQLTVEGYFHLLHVFFSPIKYVNNNFLCFKWSNKLSLGVKVSYN